MRFMNVALALLFASSYAAASQPLLLDELSRWRSAKNQRRHPMGGSGGSRSKKRAKRFSRTMGRRMSRGR